MLNLLTISLTLFFFFLAEDQICYSYSYGVRAVVQCIPAWLRFIQCLRRYRDNKRAFHLVNAGKYSTTFFVVTFAALYSTHKGTGYFGKSFTYQSLLLLLFRTPTGRNPGGPPQSLFYQVRQSESSMKTQHWFFAFKSLYFFFWVGFPSEALCCEEWLWCVLV